MDDAVPGLTELMNTPTVLDEQMPDRDALVAAVLDALSEADLRAAALYCRTTFLYDRLEAAADALHALEAEQ